MAKLDSFHTLNLSRTTHYNVRKLFAELSDDYIIRDQMIESERLSPLLIEGPNNSWAFCGYVEQELAAEELKKLDTYNNGRLERGYLPVKYLLITAQAQDLFSQPVDTPYLITLALDTPSKKAATCIQNALTAMSDAQHDNFKSQFVKESIIITKKKTRRFTESRSNDATLGNFFLDYDQEQAAKLNFSHTDNTSLVKDQEDYHVSLINGVAGSGKTLILMNRALLYHKNNPGKKFIILIHNVPVVQWVRSVLSPYISNVHHHVHTFHSFALFQNTQVSGLKVKNPVFNLQAADINNFGEQIKLDKNKIAEEIDYINEYLIADKEQYLEYDRQGRGFALQKNQRSLIWQLYEEISERMKLGNNYGKPPLASLYIRNLCLLDSTEKLQKHDHIMIDEAQFFAPSWLQLVKKSLNINGTIFMCADPNQGFLKHRLSWRKVGLNVHSSNSCKLQQPYRSTYEIMVAANRLISLIQEEDEDYVKPEFQSTPHGPKPRVVYSASQADEDKRFTNELACLLQQGNIPQDHIIVLTSGTAHDAQQLIEQRIGKNISFNINDRKQKNSDETNKIKVMSINSCTGIEAPVVLVLGVGELVKDYNNIKLSEEEKQQAMHEPIRKLYVAMTRAAQQLVLFSTESLPSILDGEVEATGRTA